jgi:hypothetical protein
MEANLIQTLWVWWGTIPADFKFLLLLPFAVGGIAVLTDALQHVLPGQVWRRSRGVTTAARATPVR